MPMTLSDPEGHFDAYFSISHASGNIERIDYDVFAHESKSARGPRNFDCRIEAGGLLKVTISHVHCKSSNISETVQ